MKPVSVRFDQLEDNVLEDSEEATAAESLVAAASAASAADGTPEAGSPGLFGVRLVLCFSGRLDLLEDFGFGDLTVRRRSTVGGVRHDV